MYIWTYGPVNIIIGRYLYLLISLRASASQITSSWMDQVEEEEGRGEGGGSRRREHQSGCTSKERTVSTKAFLHVAYVNKRLIRHSYFYIPIMYNIILS